MSVCVHACMRVCVCACMHVFVYGRVCMCTCICVCVCLSNLSVCALVIRFYTQKLAQWSHANHMSKTCIHMHA